MTIFTTPPSECSIEKRYNQLAQLLLPKQEDRSFNIEASVCGELREEYKYEFRDAMKKAVSDFRAAKLEEVQAWIRRFRVYRNVPNRHVPATLEQAKKALACFFNKMKEEADEAAKNPTGNYMAAQVGKYYWGERITPELYMGALAKDYHTNIGVDLSFTVCMGRWAFRYTENDTKVYFWIDHEDLMEFYRNSEIV